MSRILGAFVVAFAMWMFFATNGVHAQDEPTKADAGWSSLGHKPAKKLRNLQTGNSMRCREALEERLGTDARTDNTPWKGATDVTLPPFLQDVGERVVDERPGPSPSQIEALRQMEEEVGRFSKSGVTFRDTVSSLVKREYLRQRRSRMQWFSEQVRHEEGALDQARLKAIRLFENFIRRYPDQR